MRCFYSFMWGRGRTRERRGRGRSRGTRGKDSSYLSASSTCRAFCPREAGPLCRPHQGPHPPPPTTPPPPTMPCVSQRPPLQPHFVSGANLFCIKVSGKDTTSASLLACSSLRGYHQMRAPGWGVGGGRDVADDCIFYYKWTALRARRSLK